MHADSFFRGMQKHPLGIMRVVFQAVFRAVFRATARVAPTVIVFASAKILICGNPYSIRDCPRTEACLFRGLELPILGGAFSLNGFLNGVREITKEIKPCQRFQTIYAYTIIVDVSIMVCEDSYGLVDAVFEAKQCGVPVLWYDELGYSGVTSDVVIVDGGGLEDVEVSRKLA